MNTCAAGFAADRWCGNYKLTYTNNTLNFYYYSSNYKEVNFTTYENILLITMVLLVMVILLVLMPLKKLSIIL